MVILGIADGPDAGAALVIGGDLVAWESQARHDRVPRSRAFPWAAAHEVLAEAGLNPEAVDVVAVAGRFSPPLFLRRHPSLHAMSGSAFSPIRDLKVFYQAMVRQSGLWALEADRAADFIQGQLVAKGFRPQRVVMVDVHRALASSAYRCQADDDVLAFVLHPMGDGASLSLHRGVTGQLDPVFVQKGFSALHVHLQRCAEAMGFSGAGDDPLMWDAAARGEPDADLVRQLHDRLRASGGRLTQSAWSVAGRGRGVYAALAAAPREIAAASVLHNLRVAVCDVLRHHLERESIRDVVLGGAVFDNPRLVCAVAALDGVDTVSVDPFGGYGALPVGAAVSVGGVAPHALPIEGLGRSWRPEQCRRALASGGLRPVDTGPFGSPADAVAAVLAEGGSVARFSGRARSGREARGSRSVLVRADDVAGVARVRAALGLPDHAMPGCLWLPVPGDPSPPDADKLAEPLRLGLVAVRVGEAFGRRHPAVVAPDARVVLSRVDESDPELHRILAALHGRTGCAAVAVFPLAAPGEPIVSTPGDAVAVWRSTDLTALQLGPWLVRRPMA